MKSFVVIPLAAAALFVGLASSAQALTLPGDFEAYQADVQPLAQNDPNVDVYHHCHGRESGTSSWACGTRTGGPSGSLF